MPCPICASSSLTEIRCTNPDGIFYDCFDCGCLFRDPATFVDWSEEKNRYLNHENSVDDPGYVQYGKKLTDFLETYPKDLKILDFGCGAAELIKAIVGHQHQVSSYDPHFYPDQSVLLNKYDVVIASEVAEHFTNPAQSWRQISQLLKKTSSLLIVRTQPFLDHFDLQSWYYRRDPTHVVFYRIKTLDYISSKFDLGLMSMKDSNIFLFVK